jgi:uncharacterized protein YjiS (DUF1127 family)
MERKKTMTIEAIANKLRAWRRHRISMSELSSFPDRDLSDLGITRDAIERKALQIKLPG